MKNELIEEIKRVRFYARQGLNKAKEIGSTYNRGWYKGRLAVLNDLLAWARNFEGGVRGEGQAPKSLTITLRPIYEDFPQSFTVPIVPGKQVLSSLPFELNVEVEIDE